MSRETASRDGALNALSLLTGGLTAVALIGTGYVTGLAAHQTNQNNQAKAAIKAATAAQLATASRPVEATVAQSMPTPLPTRTVMATRIVQAEVPDRQPTATRRQPTGTAARGPTRRSAPAAAPAAAPVPAPAPVRAAPKAVAPAPSTAS